MLGWVEQDQAAFRSASCGNNDLSNFAKPFLQRAKWMGEIWIKATAGIEIWIGETWVMTQYCRQAWNSTRDVRTLLQNAPFFFIFSPTTPVLVIAHGLCACAYVVFSSSGSSSVSDQGCHWEAAFVSGITPSRRCGSRLTQPRTRWNGKDGCALHLSSVRLAVGMLRLHFLGRSDVVVLPATFGNGSNTTMRNAHGGKEHRTNQLPYVSFDFDSKHGRFFLFFWSRF